MNIEAGSELLHYELIRRNARLRAWRGQGMPLEGAWQQGSVPGELAHLVLRCRRCALRYEISYREVPWPAPLPQALSRQEQVVIGCFRLSGCAHLSPLLDRDPPEVRAVWELELLAG